MQFGQAALYNKQWQSAILFPTSKSEAAANISSAMLANKEKDKARLMASKALNGSLAHVEALRTIGIITFDEGKAETGQKLVEIASNLSWRDSVTQAWLFERSLRQGNYAQSIQHADALLRRRRARDEIFAMFALAARDPKLAGLVSQKLANNPPWRENFFAWSNKVPEDLRMGFEVIVNQLRDSPSPITRGELLPYTNMLAQNTEKNRALIIWANAFPAQSPVLSKDNSLKINWPDSAFIDKPSPTDWVFRSSRSINTRFNNAADSDDAILFLNMDRQALGRIAQRPLILPNGVITLELTSDAAQDRDLRKLRWFFECNGKKAGSKEEIALQQMGDLGKWQATIAGQCEIYNLVLAVQLGGIAAPIDFALGSLTLIHSR
ncbi:hypothetical protein ACR9YC_10215 [Parasphingorhabdus sp. DH2-15]|uniref:hypothetical protein n=1 Tax=Parasphingorhabdus sp. DH2-15 TaxID=3444112 RepID=UPI003F683FAA